MSTMTIGRLAKHAGVNIDTIRYYERNGLIPEPTACPGHGELECCPIIAALSGEDAR